jgi:hypothetical protein
MPHCGNSAKASERIGFMSACYRDRKKVLHVGYAANDEVDRHAPRMA